MDKIAETDNNVKEKAGKSAYVLGIVIGIWGYVLSALESIRGPKLGVMFVCCSFVIWISVLKLRYLIHGKGWFLPRTNTTLLFAISLELFLHLWFSH